MRKMVSTLIKEYKRSKMFFARDYYKIKISDINSCNFTKSDINQLIKSNLIDLKIDSKKVLLRLLLDGKLDFYKVSSINVQRQFTKNELLKIIETPNFNHIAITGMKNEPLNILNRRTLILYQQSLNFEILEKLNRDGKMTKTIVSHKKRLIQRARNNQDKEMELFLECL